MDEPSTKIDLLNGKIIVNSDTINGFALLKPGDCHVVAGTLAEGIGNIASDLDCYAFVQRLPKYGELKYKNTICQTKTMKRCSKASDEVFLTFDYYPDSYLHSEIEYWPISSIQSIINNLYDEYQQCLSHTRFLSETAVKGETHDILHRIQHAIPTFGTDVFENLFDIKEINRKLSYVLFRSTSNFYWHFKDITGALDANDPDLCFTTAKDYLDRQLTGYLYLSGYTNPRKRWVHTYLRKLHNTQPQLVNNIRNILFAGVKTDKDKFDFVKKVLVLCDEILDSESSILNTILPNHESISLLDTEMNAREMKDSKMFTEELEYRKRIYDRNRGALSNLIEQLN